MTGVLAGRIRLDAGKRTEKLTIDDASDRKWRAKSRCIRNVRDATKYRDRERAEQARLAGGRKRMPQNAENSSGPDIMVPM